MDPTTPQLIAAIHSAPRKCVIVLAGGGAQALGLLLNVPGASRTVMEGLVPYDEAALAEFLGHRPAQFCSLDTSIRIARRAFDRAGWLAPGESVLGIGCTATLTTDRPKRGDHRVHLSVAGETDTVSYSLTMSKDARDRAGEEAVVDALLLNALAAACGLAEGVSVSLLPGENVEVERAPAHDPLDVLVRGQAAAVCFEVDGRMRLARAEAGLLLPGAFNPAHDGHWQLAAVAARQIGQPAAFELSVTNVDKPSLAAAEVRRRAAQFTWRAPLWVTRSPTFVEKAALFPGAVFVVGADTAERIVQPRYYCDRHDLMVGALAGIRRCGCRFLVGGREDSSGRFVGPADFAVPEGYADLFEGIPEQEFRIAASSTVLRQQRGPSDAIDQLSARP